MAWTRTALSPSRTEVLQTTPVQAERRTNSPAAQLVALTVGTIHCALVALSVGTIHCALVALSVGTIHCALVALSVGTIHCALVS
jgi:hypothetical protein